MTKAAHAFAFMALILIAGGFFWLSADTRKVPAQLQPPAGQALLLRVHGTGDQIYSCKSDVTGYLWELKAPDAQLFDEEGKPFGRHFAGPSWEAKDGSRVTGTIVDGVPSPDASSIPWLLLTVRSRTGDGVLARVTSIQRLNTKGGKAPPSCDAAHVGEELRVPYSADYFFFVPKQTENGRQTELAIDGTGPNTKKLEAVLDYPTPGPCPLNKVRIRDLAGPWQAALLCSASGCGPARGLVNFTLDSTENTNSAVVVGHAGAGPGCGDSTTTQTFTIHSLNANGSGTAGLTCGVGCGWEFTIQVDRQRSMFNLVDVDPANPGNFVAGTAIRQEIRGSD